MLPGEAKAYCINFRITRAGLGRCKKVNLWTPGISLIGLILTLVKDLKKADYSALVKA